MVNTIIVKITSVACNVQFALALIFAEFFFFFHFLGHLREGDQLLEVNGCSLLGVSNDK